jgi:Tol biopolymer transport system component
VVFDSFATNLVPGDTNEKADVFVYDRQLGQTSRVSIASDGTEGNHHSMASDISADGRYVAFFSLATSLPGGTTAGAVFVHDRQTGVTERVSAPGTWPTYNHFISTLRSDQLAISDDGRFVAYVSGGLIYNGVLLYDRQLQVTEAISPAQAPSWPDDGERNNGRPHVAMSADGRFVVFDTLYPVAADDTNKNRDVYLRDRQTGQIERISVGLGGTQSNGYSGWPSISDDGRFVAFASESTNLVAGDPNNGRDIYVRDRSAGTTTKISGQEDAWAPAISGDGRWVAYAGTWRVQIYLYDRLTGSRQPISLTPAQTLANGSSFGVAISNDASVIAFGSAATDLVSADTNGVDDVFVVQTGSTEDLVIDFGTAYGVYLHAQGSWAPLHARSPEAMVRGDLDGNSVDDLVIDFGSGIGLYAWMNHATWTFIHPLSPVRIAVGDLDGNGQDDLIAEFSSYGIYVRRNNSVWSQLHGAASNHIVAGNFDGTAGDDLIVDFPGYGLWMFANNTTWSLRHPSSAALLHVANIDGTGTDDLVVGFAGFGLYTLRNGATWAQVHPLVPTMMASGDVDGNAAADLVMDFGGYGTYLWRNNATWTQVHGRSSQNIALADLDGNGKDDIVLDFGPVDGLWLNRDNGAWSRFHPLSSEGLLAGRFH